MFFNFTSFFAWTFSNFLARCGICSVLNSLHYFSIFNPLCGDVMNLKLCVYMVLDLDVHFFDFMENNYNIITFTCLPNIGLFFFTKKNSESISGCFFSYLDHSFCICIWNGIVNYKLHTIKRTGRKNYFIIYCKVSSNMEYFLYALTIS